MQNNSTELIERSKHGDGEAFSQLYGEYAVELYRFAIYMTGSPEDAEDAVQEAVISAWQSLHSLKDYSLFKAWLFKILSNKCKTMLMKRNRHPDSLPIEDYDFLTDNTAENLINGVELKQALASLTPPDAQIIVLSIIGGFTSQELAGIFNMTPGTVRSRQKRAIEKLKKIL